MILILIMVCLGYNYEKAFHFNHHRNNTIDFTFFSKKGLCNSGLKAKSTTFECC